MTLGEPAVRPASQEVSYVHQVRRGRRYRSCRKHSRQPCLAGGTHRSGRVFWRSGQTKIEGLHIKDSTFFLFREEYMVPLLPPDMAAYLATIAENVFSVLLIIGLASRLSAAALLGLTAVIQLFVYPSAWPEHILWVTALLVVIARGPGVISLDHLLFGRVPLPAYARS
jgi:putative oxidoreductase